MLFIIDAKFMTSEFTFCKISSIKAKYLRQQHLFLFIYLFHPASFKSSTSRDYPLNTYAKFSEKLLIITP